MSGSVNRLMQWWPGPEHAEAIPTQQPQDTYAGPIPTPPAQADTTLQYPYQYPMAQMLLHQNDPATFNLLLRLGYLNRNNRGA